MISIMIKKIKLVNNSLDIRHSQEYVKFSNVGVLFNPFSHRDYKKFYSSGTVSGDSVATQSEDKFNSTTNKPQQAAITTVYPAFGLPVKKLNNIVRYVRRTLELTRETHIRQRRPFLISVDVLFNPFTPRCCKRYFTQGFASASRVPFRRGVARVLLSRARVTSRGHETNNAFDKEKRSELYSAVRNFLNLSDEERQIFFFMTNTTGISQKVLKKVQTSLSSITANKSRTPATNTKPGAAVESSELQRENVVVAGTVGTDKSSKSVNTTSSTFMKAMQERSVDRGAAEVTDDETQHLMEDRYGLYNDTLNSSTTPKLKKKTLKVYKGAFRISYSNFKKLTLYGFESPGSEHIYHRFFDWCFIKRNNPDSFLHELKKFTSNLNQETRDLAFQVYNRWRNIFVSFLRGDPASPLLMNFNFNRKHDSSFVGHIKTPSRGPIHIWLSVSFRRLLDAYGYLDPKILATFTLLHLFVGEMGSNWRKFSKEQRSSMFDKFALFHKWDQKIKGINFEGMEFWVDVFSHVDQKVTDKFFAEADRKSVAAIQKQKRNTVKAGKAVELCELVNKVIEINKGSVEEASPIVAPNGKVGEADKATVGVNPLDQYTSAHLHTARTLGRAVNKAIKTISVAVGVTKRSYGTVAVNHDLKSKVKLTVLKARMQHVVFDKTVSPIASFPSNNKFKSNFNTKYPNQGFNRGGRFKFKRRYNKLPKASNNHFRFLLKYLFSKIVKSKTLYFQHQSDYFFEEQKELFRIFIKYITLFDKRKFYQANSLSRLFIKPQSRLRINYASSKAVHAIRVKKKYSFSAYKWWKYKVYIRRRFHRLGLAKRTRKVLDRNLQRHLSDMFKKNKYKNLFWLKASELSRKTLSILWRRYYYAPAWRPFVYLHKKNKLFFNFGDKYLFGRFPLHKYKYPLLFFFPRYSDYRRLYKNQLKEQHVFRWVYRLKFSQLIKRFRKSIEGTKRIFELMFLKYFEFRLDTIVYRLNFAFSLKHARQLVNRGLFMLNNKTIHNYAYHMSLGDVIMPIKRVRLQGTRLKYLNRKAKGYFLINIRLFYRPIQADQYTDYLFINERIPAGMIIKNIDTSTLRFNRSFSIQYLTLSLLKYN